MPIQDGSGNERELLELATETLTNLIGKRIPTFVFCSAGMSRSPLLVAAALSRLDDRPLEATLATVVGEGAADVSPALWRELSEIIRR